MAKEITAKHQTLNHQLWFEGHGGFQYYMEELGAKPVDGKRSTLQPEDVVAVSWDSGSYVKLLPGSVAPVSMMSPESGSWMTLTGNTRYGLAGFYDADWGPIPYTFGESHSGYLVAKIFTRVQYPLTNSISGLADRGITPLDDTNAISQIQLAEAYENQGNIQSAIQCYREALKSSPDSVIALNNLAWILSTGENPAAHSVNEALQLATKAATLTRWRQPVIIVTLSAAYAGEGQFSNAVAMVQAANEISTLTGQSSLTARTTRLQELYSAGKTAGSPGIGP